VTEVALYKRARYIPIHADYLWNSKAEIINCTRFLPAKMRHPSLFDVQNSKAGGIKHDPEMDSNSEIRIKEEQFSQTNHFPYVAILLLLGLSRWRNALLGLLVWHCGSWIRLLDAQSKPDLDKRYVFQFYLDVVPGAAKR